MLSVKKILDSFIMMVGSKGLVWLGLLSILLQCNIASGQPINADWRDEIMNKYWFYRYRLINDFMVIGEGAGKSLPAEKRNSNGVQFNYPGTSGFNNLGSPELEWGADATATLGWYLGVLATEYALIERYSNENAPKNLEQTAMEIYYALKALERLDKYAEQYFYPEYEAKNESLNGFFIRDDVSPDFICVPDSDGVMLECELNYYKLNSEKTKADDMYNYSYVQKVRSETVRRLDKHTTNYGWESRNIMSQDQVVSLFMGLSLISKFIPADASYNGYYFKVAAQNHMRRIVDYLSNNSWFIEFPSSKNLDGFNYEYQDKNINNIGAIGGYAGWNSTGIAEAAAYWANSSIKAPSSLWKLQAEYTFAKSCNNDMYSKKASYESNYWMFMTLIALSSAVEDFINFDANLTDISHASERLLITSSCFNFEILPLLHQVLFDYKNLSVDDISNDEKVQKLLDLAPCYGPRNFGPQNWTFLGSSYSSQWISDFEHFYVDGDGNFYGYNAGYEVYEWSSTNRFANQSRRGLDQRICSEDNEAFCSGGYRYKGEYNGLDYMLLYNLYFLKNSSLTIPRHGYYNALCPFLSIEYPNGSIGTTKDPLRLVGYEQLSSGATLNRGADITYQSPKITLTTGFKVNRDAKFNTMTEGLNTCKNGGERYERVGVIFDSRTPSESDGFFQVSPNPFDNFLNIDILTTEAEYDLKGMLYNSLGQKITDFSFSVLPGTFNRHMIAVDNLTPGNYVLVAHTEHRLFKRIVIRQ